MSMHDNHPSDVCGVLRQIQEVAAKKKPGGLGPVLKRRAAVRCHRGTAQTGVELFASVEAV
jgi:hypothetical protein